MNCAMYAVDCCIGEWEKCFLCYTCWFVLECMGNYSGQKIQECQQINQLRAVYYTNNLFCSLPDLVICIFYFLFLLIIVLIYLLIVTFLGCVYAVLVPVIINKIHLNIRLCWIHLVQLCLSNWG